MPPFFQKSLVNSFVGKQKASRASKVRPPHLIQSLNYDHAFFKGLKTDDRLSVVLYAHSLQQLWESRVVQQMADSEQLLFSTLSREKQALCNLVESGTKPHEDIPNTQCLRKAFWILIYFFFFWRKIIHIPPLQTRILPQYCQEICLYKKKHKRLLTVLAKLLIARHLWNLKKVTLCSF